MGSVSVFNAISLDGYFTDAKGDMSWAHRHSDDPEWIEFTTSNASGSDAVLLFGRVTYDLMNAYWPTPAGKRDFPEVARTMNNARKVVVSRSMDKPTWQNTEVIKSDLVNAVRRMKTDRSILILGSGKIIAQLAEAGGVIDHYQLIVNPIVLGGGRTLFDGVTREFELKLGESAQLSKRQDQPQLHRRLNIAAPSDIPSRLPAFPLPVPRRDSDRRRAAIRRCR